MGGGVQSGRPGGGGLKFARYVQDQGALYTDTQKKSKGVQATLLARVVGQPTVGQSHGFGVAAPGGLSELFMISKGKEQA